MLTIIRRFKKIYTVTLLFEIAILFVMTILAFINRSFGVLSLFALSVFGLTLLAFLLIYFLKSLFSKTETKTVLIFSSITSIIGLLLFIMIIYSRDYLYLLDYSCYFDLQNEYYNLFSDSVAKGFYGTIKSFWTSDYSYFICIFTSLPFYFTTRTHDAFVITYFIFLIIPVIIVLNMFIMSIFKTNKIENNRKLFLSICNLIIICFPVFQVDALLGMPDVFGLTFLGLLSIILFNYDIKEISWKNNILLIVLTAIVIITRRWYIFGVFGLYGGFVISSLVTNLHKLKIVFINGIKSFLLIGLALGAILAPFIYHTINANYSVAYNEWSHGGVLWELVNQCRFLGYFIVFVLIVGILYGVYNSNLRFYTVISSVSFFITLFTFTRVQNMDTHHALCLMFTYFPLIFNTVLLCVSIKNRVLKLASIIVISLIFVINMYCCISGRVIKEGSPHLNSNINLLVNNREKHETVWEYNSRVYEIFK